jgi:colanic acid biosynthesis glycosyl transferase WcaI
MASARPVLAAVPDDSEIAHLIPRAECGVRVPPEDPGAMARAIQGLSTKPEELQRLGDNGRSYACKHFDRKIVTRQYRQLLHEVAFPNH